MEFSRLGLTQQRQMYRIAVSYTASSADADDAMQEALLYAWSRRDTLRNPAYFSTWLNHNEASHRRGKSKEEAS